MSRRDPDWAESIGGAIGLIFGSIFFAFVLGVVGRTCWEVFLWGWSLWD